MNPILDVQPLGFPWKTVDPFLFCAWHDDAYPRGKADMGPAVPLAGRALGQDFSRKDGWSMYHGDSVPGFPAHPHRGFETVTIVRHGLIDHSDSLGATARFGAGDVQWLTAGGGIVHSEMFPLVREDADNPLELFQIWLNLPARSKLVSPHFTMFWREQVPRVGIRDLAGHQTVVAVIAGRFGDADALAPPPASWAAQADSDVAIWTISMQAQARWTLPAAASGETRRTLYLFRGGEAVVAGERVSSPCAMSLRPQDAVPIDAGEGGAEFLLLQGRPIGEPVAQHGPFVMNTQAEIVQAVQDYRRTQFGGWPFGDSAPVHPKDMPRFARHPDGRREIPEA